MNDSTKTHIYDSTIPSAEAVQVFDAFLTELSTNRIPTFIISGNHDSAERLGNCSRVRLVILEHRIVAWAVLFDQVALQHQRFQL